MNCKFCGEVLQQGRVDFLLKHSKPMTCLAHSTTEKVGVFMSTGGKTERELIVTDAATAEYLHNASKRAGTGVSRGVKMSQTFQPKIFK